MKEDLKKLILAQDEVCNVLEKKYNIDTYIDKIIKFAIIIPYYSDSILKGFIAYYANDDRKKDAYLSIIVISKPSQGEGLGKLLLECSISDLGNKGYSNYRLEVSKNNKNAIVLYQKNGFEIEKESENSYVLKLILKEDANS